MKKIQELIAAGKKATQGDWGVLTHDKDEFVEERGSVFIPRPHEGGFNVHKSCNPKNNAEFIAQAANARTEIETLYTLAQEMAEALKVVEADIIWGNNSPTLKMLKKALTKWVELNK